MSIGPAETCPECNGLYQTIDQLQRALAEKDALVSRDHQRLEDRVVQAEAERDRARAVAAQAEALMQDRERLTQRNARAVEVITRYGGIDGEHHRHWVIDQALRALMGEECYRQWIAERIADGYDWEEGIAP